MRCSLVMKGSLSPILKRGWLIHPWLPSPLPGENAGRGTGEIGLNFSPNSPPEWQRHVHPENSGQISHYHSNRWKERLYSAFNNLSMRWRSARRMGPAVPAPGVPKDEYLGAGLLKKFKFNPYHLNLIQITVCHHLLLRLFLLKLLLHWFQLVFHFYLIAFN